MNTHLYNSGQQILGYGEDSQFACRLLSGSAKVLRAGDVIGTITSGQYFGALAALTGNKRAATIIASEDCVVEHINNQTFKDMVRNTPETLDKIS
jgi:CRP/FNR family cyclic AMP-dependent transcriptional regulator